MPFRLRAIPGFISTKWRPASTCEACGNQFTCGATLTGCWCAEIKVSEEARAELRAQYHHCLCRDCLEKASVKSEDDSAAG